MAQNPKRRKRKKSLLERFVSKIKVSDDCWEWQGSRDRDGYGLFFCNNSRYRAHRASYRIFVGPFETDKVICHKCDNPKCVKPSHLWPDTQVNNMKDKVAKRRHVFGENHPSAILTEDQVRTIMGSRSTAAVLGAEYGVSIEAVYDIWSCRRWVHLKLERLFKQTRLDEAAVIEIRESTEVARVMSAKFGVSPKTIHRVRSGETYTDLPNVRIDRRVKGETHPFAKITEDDALEIKMSQNDTNLLEAEFGLSRSVVQKIRRNDKWKHVTPET